MISTFERRLTISKKKKVLSPALRESLLDNSIIIGSTQETEDEDTAAIAMMGGESFGSRVMRASSIQDEM